MVRDLGEGGGEGEEVEWRGECVREVVWVGKNSCYQTLVRDVSQ